MTALSTRLSDSFKFLELRLDRRFHQYAIDHLNYICSRRRPPPKTRLHVPFWAFGRLLAACSLFNLLLRRRLWPRLRIQVVNEHWQWRRPMRTQKGSPRRPARGTQRNGFRSETSAPEEREDARQETKQHTEISRQQHSNWAVCGGAPAPDPSLIFPAHLTH